MSKLHSFNAKLLSYQYCTRCGLLNLKNEVTRKAINKPCPGRDEDEKVKR